MTYSRITLIIIVFSLLSVLYAGSANSQSLSCYVNPSGSCAGSEIPLFKMNDTTNSHSELINQTNYNNVVCCSMNGGVNLGNSCAEPISDIALKLSSATNAHVEISSGTDYAIPVCLSSNDPSVPGVVCTDALTSQCPGYSVCVASFSGSTNAHVGDCSAYPGQQVCCAVLVDTTKPFTFDNTTNNWYNNPQAIKLSCTDPLDTIFNASSGCNVTQYCLSPDGNACSPNTDATILAVNHPDLESSVEISTTTWIYYRSRDKAGNLENTTQSANQVKVCKFNSLGITANCDIAGPPGTCEEGDKINLVANYSDGCPNQITTGSNTHIDLAAQSTNPECEFTMSTVCINPTCSQGVCICDENWTFPNFDGTVCADKTIVTKDANLSENGIVVIDTLSPDGVNMNTTSFNTTGFHSSFTLNNGDLYSIYRNITADVNTSINTTEATNFTQCNINWLDGEITSLCDSDAATNVTSCTNPLMMVDVPHTYSSDGPKIAELNCTANDPAGSILISPSNNIFIDTIIPEVNPFANPNPTPSTSPQIFTGLFDTFPSSLFNETGFCTAEGGAAQGGGGNVVWGCFPDSDGFVRTCDIISGDELTLGPHVITVTCNDNAGALAGRANVSDSFILSIDNTQPLCILDLGSSGEYPYHGSVPLPISWSSPVTPIEFNLKWNLTWLPGGDISEIDAWSDFNTPGFFNPLLSNPVNPFNTSTDFIGGDNTYWFSCNVTDNTTGITGPWTQPLQAIIDTALPNASINILSQWVTNTINVSWTIDYVGDSGLRHFDVQYNSSDNPAWTDWLAETAATYGVFGNNNPIFLADNVTYCFRVRMTNNALVTGGWSSQKCTTSDLTAPSINISVIDKATGQELVDPTFLPFIIAGDAQTIDITSTTSDFGSGLASHILQITNPPESAVSCGSADTCSRLNFDLEAAGGQAEFSVTAVDNASNFVIGDYFIVPNALANFNINNLFIVLGESIDVAVTVRNLKPVDDTVNLSLSGFTAGVAVFIDSNQNTLNVSLGPNERKTVFVKLIASDVTGGAGQDIDLHAVSTFDPTVTADDTLTVFVGFPASFPGLGLPAIILLIVLSSLAYIKLSKPF